MHATGGQRQRAGRKYGQRLCVLCSVCVSLYVCGGRGGGGGGVMCVCSVCVRVEGVVCVCSVEGVVCVVCVWRG